VITCQGNSPVGTPAATHEGLTCEDDGKNNNVQMNDHDLRHDFQLKAGSKRHQHIVGFENSKGGRRGLRWWRWICQRVGAMTTGNSSLLAESGLLDCGCLA
jgi:hypothetical protein